MRSLMKQTLINKILTEIFKWTTPFVPPLLKNFKYQPENKIAIELQYELTVLLRQGKLKCIWAHVPNEGVYSKNKNFSQMNILRSMGKAAGFPDYVFFSKNKILLIELKAGKNKLNPSQEVMQEWCNVLEIPYHICRSKEEVFQLLEKADFIDLSTNNVSNIVYNLDYNN